MVLVTGNSLALRPNKEGEPLFNMKEITVAFNGINKFIEKIRPAQLEKDSLDESNDLNSITEELKLVRQKLGEYDYELSYKIECDLAVQMIVSNRKKMRLKNYNYGWCSSDFLTTHRAWKDIVQQLNIVFRRIPERDSWYLSKDFEELIKQLNSIYDSVEDEVHISEKTDLVYQPHYRSWPERIFFFLFG